MDDRDDEFWALQRFSDRISKLFGEQLHRSNLVYRDDVAVFAGVCYCLGADVVEVFEVYAVFAHRWSSFLVDVCKPTALLSAQVQDFEANADSAFSDFAAYHSTYKVAPLFEDAGGFYENGCFSDSGASCYEQYAFQRLFTE